MAFTPVRTRRTFSSTKSSSKSGSSIPKSSTGKTSSGADYSVVEGNPTATETNRQKAEGIISTASGTKLDQNKVGVSGGAPSQEKSLLPVSTSDVALADLTKKLQDFRDTLAGMEQQKQNVAQQEQLAKQEEANRKQLEADQKLQQDKLSIERQNADTKAATLQGVSSGSIEDMATKAVQAGLVGSTMDYRKAVQNGTSAEIDAKLSRAPEIQTESDYSTQDYSSDLTSLDRMSDRMYDRFISQTNQIKNGTFPLSASENAILSETRKSFERTKQEQATANAAYVGAVKQSGIRRGGEYTDKQYAGEIQAAVSDGIQKIADIDSKAALTLAELQKGFDEENYKIINDQYTAFNNLMKTKTEAISALHQSAMEHEKFVYTKAKDQRDFVTQQEQREIENERAATQLADNLLTSSSNRATDALQREKLITDITKAKRELADMDMTVVGQDASYPAYYNAVANATIGLPENQRKEITANLNKYLKAGDTESAKELILRTAFQGQTGTQREDSIKRSQAVDSLNTVKELLNDYVAVNGDTGLLSGNMQKVQQKLGQEGTPEAAAINARITQALQIYRNAITGAAWGEQETGEYEQLFPDLTNTNKLNVDIIDSMTNALNANNRIAVGQYIGQTAYDDIFEPDRNVDDYLESSLGELENAASSGDQAIEEFLQGLNLTY